jgi:hypothetical protein
MYSLPRAARAGIAQSLGVQLQTGRPEFGPRQRKRISPLASVSRPTPRPTQPHIQWVPGVLSQGIKRGRGLTLTTHPHLQPRPLPLGACMAVAGPVKENYWQAQVHLHSQSVTSRFQALPSCSVTRAADIIPMEKETLNTSRNFTTHIEIVNAATSGPGKNSFVLRCTRILKKHLPMMWYILGFQRTSLCQI